MVNQFFDPHKTILEIRMVNGLSYVVLGLMDKVSLTHTHTHSLSLSHTQTHI